MNNILNVLRSSLGYKILMAFTGLGLLGFVISHLLGNLQIFLGQQAFNDYAHLLKSMPVMVLWGARLGLLVILFIHIGVAVRLKTLNQQARPIPYLQDEAVVATFSARNMFLTGSLIFTFVVYHLLHFTLGFIYPSYFERVDANGLHDVYSMVILGFHQPIITVTYLLAMILLGIHLSHGISSFFRSLGISEPKLNTVLNRVGIAVATIIVLGYISIPLSVLAGCLTLPH